MREILEYCRIVGLEAWDVLGQMAPYLLFGFFVAGVLSLTMTPAWVERHLGSRGIGPIFKASLFGVPLPLCSCGVIPVSASIRQRGASKSAVVSFLLSTPQTGIDSIAVTYALLGPFFAVFRPVAAFATGIIGGLLVKVFDDDPPRPVADPPAPCEDACSVAGGGRNRFVECLRYGFVTLPKDIGRSMLIGIAIAGALAAVIPADYFANYLGGGILAMVVTMLLGIPVYVCATASVPVALGLMHAGASPGAALVFLIAGPASNAATFATIWKVLGRRTAVIYVATVAACALASGLLLDSFVAAGHVHGAHEHGEFLPAWASHVSAGLLLLIIARGMFSGAAPKAVLRENEFPDGMREIGLKIGGMTCGHCAASVERVLGAVAGVSSATVNLAEKRAALIGEDIDVGAAIGAVEGLGYTAEIESH